MNLRASYYPVMTRTPRSRADRRPRGYGPPGPVGAAPGEGEDAADVHVRRWAGWDDIPFDHEVEEVTVRLMHLSRYLDRTTAAAVRTVGLERHDYQTLHALMIRETPGYAGTGELAEAARVSKATMTGRVDRLERLGLVRRLPSEEDRRVVHVQVTDEGFSRWRRAMVLRGEAEDALFAGIERADVRRLADGLRGLLVRAEELEAGTQHDEA